MQEPTKSTRNWTSLISPAVILFSLYAIFFMPFWQPLILAFVFACACAPLVHYLRSKLHSGPKWTAAMIVTTLFLLITLPLTFSALKIYSLVDAQLQDPQAMEAGFEKFSSVKNQIIDWLKLIPFINDQTVETQATRILTSLIDQVRGFLLQMAKGLIIKTPDILLNLFIFLMTFAVILAWGSKKWAFISRFPLLGTEGNRDYSKFYYFEKVCSISIGSILLTGAVQATVVGIGSGLAGYSVFLPFLLAFFLSLIPVVGAGSVPFFLTIYSFANNQSGPGFIFLVTTLIAGSIDNLLRAWLFSRAANTNPVVSLLALLGGISLFGFTGLFLAPIVEQLTMAYLFNGNRPSTAGTKENLS